MKIYQEVTEWKEIATSPNHVYLMDGDKAYAYVPHGKGQPQYFKTFLRIDRRGRKFVEVKRDQWGFRINTQPQGRSWTVTGSKGNEYTVTEHEGQWACTCSGFVFRGTCRHIKETQS